VTSVTGLRLARECWSGVRNLTDEEEICTLLAKAMLLKNGPKCHCWTCG
jgi:hypothetical protein